MMRPETWSPGDVAVSRRDPSRMLLVVAVEHQDGDPWPVLVYERACCREPGPTRVSSYWFRPATAVERLELGSKPASQCVCHLRERRQAAPSP